MNQTIQQIAIMVLPLLFAVTLHEAAHAWVADKKGDSTARMLGRITLNPWVHTDLFGTIIIPLLLFTTTGFIFGYAKPVPVNPFHLRRPKQDMAWVAAAGPGMNLLLAVISGVLYRAILLIYPQLSTFGGIGNFGSSDGLLSAFFVPLLLMLRFSVTINILLMVFNLIPIPPLDGGRVLVGILPERQSRLIGQIEPYGMLLLIVLVFIDPFGIMQRFFWPIVSVFTGYIFGEWVI
ncbi:MAG: site-2 protease family protein [Candidatus Manganitrophus sp.]|nr:site-2 protease family protein [Candidatus Manganitrophus morganii]MDC4203402.1 site-2 protease family protein [Candidatus Manganitrophus sp.]MDC4225079.1 site-2 protease family protein [Candidatus Manganitrophus sp.]WDT71664.1 MAG: site-2 protease family protein [Candidatus Manganitrophus sp.]WDT80983.1 MAG: site-2 protease family protein [Candidatus Manganitrophus sp.]